MKNKDSIFLSKWLNNQLSDAELKEFQASEDYDIYMKIIQGTSQLKAPEYDLDNAFQKLKDKRDNRATTQPKKWLHYSVAASVILFLGLLTYFIFLSNTIYSSDFGEQLAFKLPDGSKVILNSKSTISFNKRNWDNDRTLELKGEAFFDVEKGNTFTVKTKQGNISVLGTEFNVKAEKDFFEVSCYEGKVKVEDYTNNNISYLTPSVGYRYIKNTKAITLSFDDNLPDWINHQSSFKSVPIKYVFNALEKHYNIHFEYKNFNDNVLFTGSFPNNNKEIALETVLKSVNLKYTVKNNSIILQD